MGPVDLPGAHGGPLIIGAAVPAGAADMRTVPRSTDGLT